MMKTYTLLLILLVFSITSLADVRTARIFGSNMVLQQGKQNPIWGWAKKGEKITVSLNGKTVKTKAGADGKWMLKLPEMEYGGPYTMLIKGQNTIEYTNVMIGEVWICSGQSNMDWPVDMSNHAKREINEADYPNIRLFQVKEVSSQFPRDDFSDEEWAVCSPNTIPNFSAVGYFFGRDLHLDLGVAIGLIHTARGGTVAETWTSSETIEDDPDFSGRLKELENLDLKNYADVLKDEITKKLGGYPTKDQGEEMGYHLADVDVSDWIDMKAPRMWELQGFDKIDGVVWYQTTFDLTKEAASDHMTLSLATVDDKGVFWINGKEIGRTDSYRTDVSFLVKEEFLKPGRNVLTARITDIGGGGGFKGKDTDFYIRNQVAHINLAGIWKATFTEIANNSQKLNPNEYPTLLYNGMVHPLVPYGIRGAIWYQGESNSSRAEQYQRIFPNMIKDWRAKWGEDFPFIWVQLANFLEADDVPSQSNWAELREAQTMALYLPNTGQALAIDLGEVEDIHPRNKQDVGNRLALGAKAVAYGQDVVFVGPTYKSMSVDGNMITLTFSNVGSGLMLKDRYGYLKGFAVAGEKGKFHWAKGYIDGDQAVIWSDQVPKPIHVRYAWSNNPDDVNLYNKEGLPAVPFRTDNR